jgi:type IV pilus assembly protein PilB
MASVAVGGNPIGDLLLQEGLLTRDQLMAAVAEAKSGRLRLSYVVAKSGLVPEIEVTKLLARHYRMPAVDLSKFEVDSRTLQLIPSDVAAKHIVLPLKREGRTLTMWWPTVRPRPLGRPEVHHPIRPLSGHRRRGDPQGPDRAALRVGR